MRCHYEVLGVERDANDDILKKSYRKLALQWHPDKNPDRIEECTRVFHEIQEAYEVLTDPQERAWYDKHREAILRGGDNYVDNALDLMGYFNPSIFSGYGDDKNGFYAVYANVFNKIAEEDDPYRDEDNDETVPEFGNSQSSFEEVVGPFYAYWRSYCTLRTYVWVEKYDVRQAPNRPTQRAMEKENKKAREASRKVRNEEVQELVAFIRKRDQRVKTYRKELEEKQKEQKIAFEKKRSQQIKEKNEQLKNYQEQEWTDYNNMSKQLADIEAHFNDDFKSEVSENLQNESDEEEFVPGYYCVACDKPFKSEKALINHEKSKKHKTNVELIKKQMEEDLLTSSNTQANSSIGEEHSSEELERYEPEGSENPNEIVDQSLNITNNIDAGNNSHVLLNQINRPKENDTVTDNKPSNNNLSDSSNQRQFQREECIGEEAINSHMEDMDYIDDLPEGYIINNDSNLNYMDSLNLPAMRARRQAQQKYDDEEHSSDEDKLWNSFVNRGISLGISPKDSLNLPRRSSSKKKKMMAKQKDRREDLPNSEDDVIDGLMKNKEHDIDVINDPEFVAKYADAQLGSSYVTNSLKVNKKKTKSKKNKTKQQLFNIEEADISGNKSDDNVDSITDNTKNASEHFHGNDHTNEQLNKETVYNQGNDIAGCQTQSHVNLDTKKDKPTTIQDNDSVGFSETLYKCNVCQSIFPTRNKLFGHVKSEGHALKIEGNDTSHKKIKKGKKKNKC